MFVAVLQTENISVVHKVWTMKLIEMKKKNNKEIKIIDVNIPYEEIKDEKNITFVVITKDEKVLEETLKAITNIYNENRDRNITVVISSDYEKLNKVTNGKLQCPFSFKYYIILIKLDNGGTTNDKKK